MGGRGMENLFGLIHTIKPAIAALCIFYIYGKME